MADKSILERLMTETWPARTAKSILEGLMLPGDVAQGRTALPSAAGIPGSTDYGSIAGQSALERLTNLAGTVMGGAYAAPPVSGGAGMIRAYHGSPHDFERFDMSKIGTGEGAQAYGHGLYFAENPKVAQEYRDALSRQNLPASQQTDLAQSVFTSARGDFDLASKKLRDEIAYYERKGWPTPDYRTQYDEALAKLARGDVQIPGRMYEVNINAKPEQFLDWDKPLAGQSPQTQESLLRAREVMPKAGMFTLEPERTFRPWRHEIVGDPTKTGSEIYTALKNRYGITKSDATAATDTLNKVGIPGIKYLDQGSRGAIIPKSSQHLYKPWGGELDTPTPTSNYVLFRDDIINIIKKYGILGALMAGGGAAGSDQAQAAP